MKFLADVGIARSTVEALRERGQDATHLAEQGLQHLADAAILRKAREEQRILLTLDLDFGDLVAAGLHLRPSVVIFRLRNRSPSRVTTRLLQVLGSCPAELESGAVVIVEDAGHRVRRLPISSAADRPG